MRRVEAGLFEEFFPGPHFGGGAGGERKTELMSEHADLAAMMGLMGEHVGEHGSARGPGRSPAIAMKLFDATVGSEGFGQQLRAEGRTFFQGPLRLWL